MAALHSSTLSRSTTKSNPLSRSPRTNCRFLCSSIHFSPNNRRPPFRSAAAAVTSAVAVTSEQKAPPTTRLTYLEANGWLWDVDGVTILVDPILVGNLDFGVPWLFDGAKKKLGDFKLDDLPAIDCLLITQSLDDHCHVKTLKPLSQKFPRLPVVATPNAEPILSPMFNHVRYLEPGQTTEIEGKDGAKVNVFATAGPILGPPWQRPENGYIITSKRSHLTLYYEPHCVYNQSFLQNCQAEIIITPVVKQLLPSFTLVSGQEDAVQLAKLLQAKYVVVMKNGDLDNQGILSSILKSEGTVESFKVFADHDSSCESICVAREWIWNLPRLTIYFGTSVPTKSDVYELMTYNSLKLDRSVNRKYTTVLLERMEIGSSD